MKKTLQDGTVIEGTPEELVEYEKLLWPAPPPEEQAKPKKQPDANLDALTKALEAARKAPKSNWFELAGSDNAFSGCAYDAFMRNNPGFTGPLGLVCYCPKCSIWSFVGGPFGTWHPVTSATASAVPIPARMACEIRN